MKTTMKAAVLLVLGAALTLTVPARAAEKTVPATPAKGAGTEAKATRYPINGKLAAVDKLAKTFTLKGAETNRVFKVNAKTKITKHGKPATLADAVVGEDVGGFVEKQADGSVLALSVRFGPKPDPRHKATEPVKTDDSKDKPKKTN
jgi:hypothetical protein